ncbi:MAG: hypothetical protein AAFY02_19775 [Pseudomonadota bacterium]
MQNAAPRATRRPLLPALALAAAPFLLAACSTVEREAGQQLASLSSSPGDPVMAPASMPFYQPGQTFTFDDGQRDQVIGIEGMRVIWRDEQSRQEVTTRNFVEPVLERGSRQRAVVNDASGLWPLQVGKSDRMRIARSRIEADGTRTNQTSRNYNCRVSNTEMVMVPAGEFETYRVQCNRFSNSGKRLVETQVWYYAPEVGHYVKWEEIDRKTGNRNGRSLISYSG